MHRLMIAAAALALAAPALSQPVVQDDPLADEMVRALPPAAEVEALAPAMDRVVGSLLDVDVGPILDAADPYRRRPGYGVPGRTIGDMARRDDPWFEERLRSSIYGTTAGIGRMMEAFAAAAPAIAVSLRQMEHAIGAAVDDYHRRRAATGDRPGYPEDGDYPEDWNYPED